MHPRREMQPESTIGFQRESFGNLFSELANQSSALVRDEIQLAKQEMSEKIVSFRKGAILIVTGAVIGLPAILSLTAAAVIGLANYIGFGYSALLIGGVLLVIAMVVASIGLEHIKRTSLKPEQTIATLQEDKEWLKELT